jgi:hypothetical protein
MHRRPQIAIVTVGAFSVSADSAYLGIRALCHAHEHWSQKVRGIVFKRQLTASVTRACAVPFRGGRVYSNERRVGVT